MTAKLALSCAVACWGLAGAAAADHRGEIVSSEVARAHGLTRTWIAQAAVDPSRSRVKDLVLYEGVLYVQTNRGLLHAFDAETGRPVWDSGKQIGNPEYPSMTPGVYGDLVAVVNGSRLYVLSRYSGDLLLERQVDAAPGAGAAVSESWVYVPMINQVVIAYRLMRVTVTGAELPRSRGKADAEEPSAAAASDIRLSQESFPPLACHSTGRSLVQPVVTRLTENEECVAWPSDRGYLMLAAIDRLGAKFALSHHLQTRGDIVAPPVYLPPDPEAAGEAGVVYAVSEDGSAYAVNEKTGQMLWRFSTSEPIVRQAAVIDENVYVPTQLGGMYCLDAKNGAQKWWSPQIVQFLSASQDRVYAADGVGRLWILDARTGARLHSLEIARLPLRLLNMQTDRIYLATVSGLIQCLHETQLDKPLAHAMARKRVIEKTAAPEKKAPGKKAEAEAPAAEPAKAAEPAAPAAAGAEPDPFGAAPAAKK